MSVVSDARAREGIYLTRILSTDRARATLTLTLNPNPDPNLVGDTPHEQRFFGNGLEFFPPDTIHCWVYFMVFFLFFLPFRLGLFV